MKQLLRPIVLLSVFLIFIFGTNYFVDPANVFNEKYEETLVDILVGGHSASGVENMDDRRFIELMAKKRTKPIDTLVLGSSRTLQITPAVTGDVNTFTAGVTGSDLRDCISGYFLFKDAGFTPSKVVLSLDFWYLSRANMDARALTEGYTKFCTKENLTPVKTSSAKMNKVKTFFSFTYFQSSIDYLVKGKHSTLPMATDSFYTDLAVKRPDGSYGYEESIRNATQETIDLDAKNKRLVDTIAANFTQLDKDLSQQLDSFIGYLSDQGVEVRLLLSPVHPIYYDYIKEKREDYSLIFESEAYYRSLGEKYGVSVYGSFDPEKVGLTRADFYDAIHPTEEALMKYYDLTL